MAVRRKSLFVFECVQMVSGIGELGAYRWLTFSEKCEILARKNQGRLFLRYYAKLPCSAQPHPIYLRFSVYYY